MRRIARHARQSRRRDCGRRLRPERQLHHRRLRRHPRQRDRAERIRAMPARRSYAGRRGRRFRRRRVQQPRPRSTAVRCHLRRWPAQCSDRPICSTTESTTRPRPRSRRRQGVAIDSSGGTEPPLRRRLGQQSRARMGRRRRVHQRRNPPISSSGSPTRSPSIATTASRSAIPTASARTASAIRRTWPWTVREICTWPTRATIACSNTIIRSPSARRSSDKAPARCGDKTAASRPPDATSARCTINATSMCFPEGAGGRYVGRSVRLRYAQQSRARVQAAGNAEYLTGAGDTVADNVFGQGGIFTTGRLQRRRSQCGLAMHSARAGYRPGWRLVRR